MPLWLYARGTFTHYRRTRPGGMGQMLVEDPWWWFDSGGQGRRLQWWGRTPVCSMVDVDDTGLTGGYASAHAHSGTHIYMWT